jgi:hypothetical protein
MSHQVDINWRKMEFLFKSIEEWKLNPILYKNELERLSSGKKVKISHYLISIPEIIDQIRGYGIEFLYYFDEILRLELLTDEVIERWFYNYFNPHYFADLRGGSEKVDLRMELLLYFISMGEFELSLSLANLHFDPNYRNYKGETFFHILFKKGVIYIFEGNFGDEFIFENLKRMKDINLKSDKGKTLLIIASNNKECNEVIPLLLECGSDVNIQDSEGNTPLLIAALNGNFSIVKILLEAGSDVYHRNKKAYDICSCMKNMGCSQRGYVREFILILEEKKSNIKGAIKREEGK